MRETDRQAGRQADRQADRQTDRQTGRQADRQTDRERRNLIYWYYTQSIGEWKYSALIRDTTLSFVPFENLQGSFPSFFKNEIQNI